MCLWKLASYWTNTFSKYTLNISCILTEHEVLRMKLENPNTDSHGNYYIEECRQWTNKQCVHRTMVVTDMRYEEKEQIKYRSIRGEK